MFHTCGAGAPVSKPAYGARTRHSRGLLARSRAKPVWKPALRPVGISCGAWNIRAKRESSQPRPSTLNSLPLLSGAAGRRAEPGLEGRRAFVHRVEKTLLPQLASEADPLENLAQRPVGVGKLHRDALLIQLLFERLQGFGRRHVNLRDRLRINHQPAHRRRAGGDQFAHALGEMPAVREQQRRIETISDEAGDRLAARLVSEVVEHTAGDLRARPRRAGSRSG